LNRRRRENNFRITSRTPPSLIKNNNNNNNTVSVSTIIRDYQDIPRLTLFTANIIYKLFWVVCFVTIRGPAEISYPGYSFLICVLDRPSLSWCHEGRIIQSSWWHLRCFRGLIFSSLLTVYHLHPLLCEIECVLTYYKIRSGLVWKLLSAYLFFLVFDAEGSAEKVGHISGKHSDRSAGTAASFSARRPIGGSRTWCVPSRPPGGTWRIL